MLVSIVRESCTPELGRTLADYCDLLSVRKRTPRGASKFDSGRGAIVEQMKKQLIDVPSGAKEIITVYLMPEGVAVGMCVDLAEALRTEPGYPHVLINAIVACVKDTLETALTHSDGSLN